MRLLANHFKEELPTTLRPLLAKQQKDASKSSEGHQNLKPRLGRGFQKRNTVNNAIPGETRIEKQLRKAIEAVKVVNYFKAVCCYSKVSKAFNKRRTGPSEVG